MRLFLNSNEYDRVKNIIKEVFIADDYYSYKKYYVVDIDVEEAKKIKEYLDEKNKLLCEGYIKIFDGENK